MKKSVKIIIFGALALVLLGIAGYFIYSLSSQLEQQKEDNDKFRKLAEMDKKEMENEYAQFALQYDEMKRTVKNDSLLHRIEQEQNRANALLAELKKVKNDDAAEIARLKKELATVRAVLRSYIIQVDSLNRLNQSLRDENAMVKQQYTTATTQISTLTEEKQTLTKTVAIAAQLDATGLSLQPQNKKGKLAKKTKDIAKFVASFRISRNVTAKTGERRVYLRILKPTNEVLGQSGTFSYEGTQLGYSAVKTVEYNGEETPVTMFVNVNEMLTAGTYRMFVFVDGQMIGSTSVAMTK
ncbi:MAG: hypothetical protein J5729_04425 [Bacteroidaceae bacterium]|nr:hypothetical protein [Bacteroidaceae bacterium]MBO4593452.1 hypothetical protein [Bacteroidaceae bacterium]